MTTITSKLKAVFSVRILAAAFALMCCLTALGPLSIVAYAAETPTPGGTGSGTVGTGGDGGISTVSPSGSDGLLQVDDFSNLIDTMTQAVTPELILGILGIAIAGVMGITLAMWGARKVARIFSSSLRSGSLRL